jgi:hypothetical protein
VKSRTNSGTLADCLIDWTRAESVEAKVAAIRAAELVNLLVSRLK